MKTLGTALCTFLARELKVQPQQAQQPDWTVRALPLAALMPMHQGQVCDLRRSCDSWPPLSAATELWS